MCYNNGLEEIMKQSKKELIKYFKSLGIEVYTNTKARGHQGFFLNGRNKTDARIDISKNVKDERLIPTLLHEFSHYIHWKLEPDMGVSGGSLELLFNLESLQTSETSVAIQKSLDLPPIFQSLKNKFFNDEKAPSPSKAGRKTTSIIKKELLAVTHFVDENSLCKKLNTQKAQTKEKIKNFESIIKQDYPNFMRSKKFKEFDKYIRKSKAKYLLKYDRVKLLSPFLRREEIYSIDYLERDFCEMPQAFCAYIRLKSYQRKQSRISSRINKLNKYYAKPTELFARFVEGLYIDEARVRALAPHTTQRFFELLEQGYYFELKDAFEILQKIKQNSSQLAIF